MITTNDRYYQQSKEDSELTKTNFIKKKQSPVTLITRKKINQNEQIVYEASHSEQIQAPTCNTHTLKKKRPLHTITTTGNSSANGQNNNTKQISKQILHAIMNSMNNNQEQVRISPRPASSSVNDEFFDNGPLTNPEETIANITTST